jgi:predicted RNA-binding Zn ribbon-like protein
MIASSIETLRLDGGHPALDFANTLDEDIAGTPHDHLVDYAALLAWSRRLDLVRAAEAAALRKAATARPAEAARVLAKALDLRDAIYRLFTAQATDTTPPRAALARFNRHLAEALFHAALAPAGDGFAWRWAGEPDALDRPLWPLARAAAELLADQRRARVRICAGHHCHWLFLDLSKNGARRWCSMSVCGNRTKIRRFRGQTT